MPGPAVVTQTVVSNDGTSIAYHDSGGTGPAIVLANGLAGPFAAWRHQLEYLADRHRIIGWDYRGLFGSVQASGKPTRIDVSAHVDDLERVLEKTSIERAAFIGWSMGVQVVLALYERRPELVSHLVFINGTYGKPLDTTGMPFSSRVVPSMVDRVRRFHEIAAQLLKRATRWPETVLWMRRLGLIGNTVDEELFREIASQFGTTDLELYFAMLRELSRHDASHVLDTVQVPTLVITGDRDPFTPRQLAQQMARRIPGGEILVVRGATHYAMIEYPELVNLRIEKFLREHGL